MKLIGLIGGTTWQSTKEYYRILNEAVASKLGGHHSARILISSVDYEAVFRAGERDDGSDIQKLLCGEASRLEGAGAEILLIGANTLHEYFEAVSKSVQIPVLHIADEVGTQIRKEGLHRVALLGTRFTMGRAFYSERLKQLGIETLTPKGRDFVEVNRVIYEELAHGQIKKGSKQRFVEVIHQLQRDGAEGVILGCTEIPLLISPEDVNIPVFNSTEIHALAGLRIGLEDK